MKKHMGARAKAKLANQKTYWTGNPCPQGHVDERYTSSGGCVVCLKAHVASRVSSGYFSAHYKENSERILSAQRRYNAANSEAINARSSMWAARNPIKRRAISRQYKARRRVQVDVGISGGMLAAWIREQPKACFYCGADCAVGFHVDHFMPLAKGGAHVLTNLRIACATCNLHKSAMLPGAWMEKCDRHRSNPLIAGASLALARAAA